MQEITSPSNQIIKTIKGLSRKKERWIHRLFIIEGIKMIIEGIENHADMNSIIISETFFEDNCDFVEKHLLRHRNVIKVPDRLFSQISTLENPDGILATINIKPDTSDLDVGLYLYLDGLQDPGNLGTIIRSCDAFNISGIIIGEESVDPYSPKVVRASMGSIFRTKILFMSRKGLIDKKNEGYRLISTAINNAVEIDKVIFSPKDIIVIGNEGNGVSSELEINSDIKITIPMKGKAESLNAGVAASIIMYTASRR